MRRHLWPTLRKKLALHCAILLTVAGLAACGSSDQTAAPASELRLGYFPNLTHAPALIGVADGTLQKSLGDVALKPQTFSAGPAVVEALFSGTLDAAFVGPSPTLNAFVKSKGQAVRIISGATVGGAAFVVKPEVTTENLRGRTFASPQLGNTQDVALRSWLLSQGLKAPRRGGGDVNVQPSENSATLDLFKSGKIDGAWVPEPWASRLVLEGGGKVLVDEASLWPEGRFTTTHLVVSTTFLERNPSIVGRLLAGHLNVLAAIEKNPERAKSTVNAALEALTGKALAAQVLDRAWPRLRFTADPVASSLKETLTNAVRTELTKDTDLSGIYDLTLLNKLLADRGSAPVDDSGLGPKQAS